MPCQKEENERSEVKSMKPQSATAVLCRFLVGKKPLTAAFIRGDSLYFWWQKYQNHPHVVLRGIVFRPVLSGRSKIEPLQPPAPGARSLGQSLSAPNDNAEPPRHETRRIIRPGEKEVRKVARHQVTPHQIMDSIDYEE